MSKTKVAVKPVTPDRWPDMLDLAERPGPRGGTPILGSCWCLGTRDAPRWPREARRQTMCDLVQSGCEPGLLAYIDGRPMGWIAVAPRIEQSKLDRSRIVKGVPADETVFSITCFYVDPEARGEGVASALLDGAIAHARKRGGTVVEGFPKAEPAAHARKGGRAEEADSFRGRRGAYERRGFTAVKRSDARILMRLELT